MPQFVQSEQQRELISSLVQELPAYRKKMRMSQAELGDAVGKSRQKISEMERGSPRLGHLSGYPHGPGRSWRSGAAWP